MNRLITATLAVAGLLLAGSPARSALVTYDLAGTVSSGPLSGQTFGGYLSFHDSPASVGGTLVDLSFTFNGSTVDESNVATQVNIFADDFVTVFGTACIRHPLGLGCSVSAGDPRWYVEMQGTYRQIYYSLPGSPELVETFSATLRKSTVPEPGTLGLALAAGLGLLAARRRA